MAEIEIAEKSSRVCHNLFYFQNFKADRVDCMAQEYFVKPDGREADNFHDNSNDTARKFHQQSVQIIVTPPEGIAQTQHKPSGENAVYKILHRWKVLRV